MNAISRLAINILLAVVFWFIGLPAAAAAGPIARISHHPSTADADLLAVTGRTPSSRFDVVSTTTSPSSGPCTPSQRHLDALATNGGEKCGLVPPRVKAKAWLLVDHHSGRVLASHNADRRIQPAGLAKLMTAYVLFQRLQKSNLSIADTVRIGDRAQEARGPRIFLQPEVTVPVQALLKGMIVQGANDAAVALAEYAAGSEAILIREMNRQAVHMDLDNTRFVNVTGDYNRHQYSSARDLAKIAQNLIDGFPEYYQWYAEREYRYVGITHYNRNALLWRNLGVDGVGVTQARQIGYHLIASAVRDKMRLTAVILGAASERVLFAGAQQLFRFGYDNYDTRLLYRGGVTATRVRVWMGNSDLLPLGVKEDVYLTMRRGTYSRLRARLTVQETPYAPVQQDQELGTLGLDLGDRLIAEYPLIALKNIEVGNVFQRAWDRLQLWLNEATD